MEFVVDASFLANLIRLDDDIRSETIDFKNLLLSGQPVAMYAPEFVLLELASIVWQKKRKGFSVSDDWLEAFRDYGVEMIPLGIDEMKQVFHLALTKSRNQTKRNALTVYDAHYLWLAQKWKIPLLTYDQVLRRLS